MLFRLGCTAGNWHHSLGFEKVLGKDGTQAVKGKTREIPGKEGIVWSCVYYFCVCLLRLGVVWRSGAAGGDTERGFLCLGKVLNREMEMEK